MAQPEGGLKSHSLTLLLGDKISLKKDGSTAKNTDSPLREIFNLLGIGDFRAQE